MKIIHTADWHLGKYIHGVRLLEEQRHVLYQLIELIQTERPDVLLLAGDIFDRAVPATEAVSLLDELCEHIVEQCGTPLIMIAGNHDSAERLQFGHTLLAKRNLYISGSLDDSFQPIVLHDAAGPVYFHRVPYVEPAAFRVWLQHNKPELLPEEIEQVRSHDQVWSCLLSLLQPLFVPEARHVLLAHAFVVTSSTEEEPWTEAERPLSIGGAQGVASTRFAPFHYVALGHLHRAHPVGTERVRYAGSPYPYSLQECDHEKSVTIVDLDATGNVNYTLKPLQAVKKMRVVRTTMEQLMTHEPSDDYVFVQLIASQPILYPMESIRKVYPNALHMERIIPEPEASTPATERESWGGIVSQNPLTQFASFYEEIWQTPCTEPLLQTMAAWMETIRASQEEPS